MLQFIKRFFHPGDLLTGGFGITVVMWVTGYVFRLPVVQLPSFLLFFTLLLCLMAGGFFLGMHSRPGWKRAFYAGLLSSVLNLLILGSLLAEGPAWAALIWVPGFMIISALLAALGGHLSETCCASKKPTMNWPGSFALVACVATFFLLIAGGLVTSNQAGLAVVDWPNSFGYNMFLFPLSHMTGGIYYEHTHRLFGSLVGLTTICLAAHVWAVDSRPWLRWLVLFCVPMVIVQGVMGGLRVTGHFTLSTSPEVTQPNIYLAIAHGVLGQLFFALIVSIAVFTSKKWLSREAAVFTTRAPLDRRLNLILVILVLLQITIGAFVRHLSVSLMEHITLALVVMVWAVLSGARAWGFYESKPLLQKLGLTLIALAVLQIILGFITLAAVGYSERTQSLSVWDITFATLHQGNGALIFAFAVMLMLWTYRLVKTPPSTD